MGYGSYRASDWDKLRNSRGISHATAVNEIFKNTKLNPKYDPRNINMRESVDSADSPESTPIIIAFDDTSSMGYLAKEIAQSSLNKTITEIYDKNPVTNPHVMCAAFGNCGDPAPLQVTQYEADIRIVEQLLDLWLVLRGRGDSGDPLVWYFAAKHTKIDSFDKRGKKGFLFTIGDDDIKRTLSSEQIATVFGDIDVNDALTPKQVLTMAQEKYNVFHIITKPLRESVCKSWETLLPNSTALVREENVKDLYMVIISIMQLVNGMDRKDIISQWPAEVRHDISGAIKDVRVGADAEPKSFIKKIFGKS